MLFLFILYAVTILGLAVIITHDIRTNKSHYGSADIPSVALFTLTPILNTIVLIWCIYYLGTHKDD